MPRCRFTCSVLLAALALTASPLGAAVALRYGGPAGQVAEYRLAMKVTGYQVSLGQRRPIKAELEWQVREEVLSRQADGSAAVRLTIRLTHMKDPTGAFNGRSSSLPAVQLRLSPTGEVLASALDGENAGGMMDRALASFLASSTSVVLPAEEAEPGIPWRWERNGASQENTLLAVGESASGPWARITSTGRAPLALEERSQALGLSTRLAGSQTQTSTLELLLDPGVALRHQGTSTVRSNTEVTLESPTGPHLFSLELSAGIEFDLRLIRLNGTPVAVR